MINTRLFLIIGKSASGKDTIERNLLNDTQLSKYIKPFVNYTTREKRKGETDGVEYNFVTNQELVKLKAEDKLVYVNEYTVVNPNTGTNIQTYYAYPVLESLGNYIAVVPPNVAQEYMKHYQFDIDKHIIPIYIKVDDRDRLIRCINREFKGKQNYKEVCRRFLADEEDFNPAVLEDLEISARNTFENEDLNECIKKIKNFILRYAQGCGV